VVEIFHKIRVMPTKSRPMKGPMKGTVKEKLLPTGNRAHFDDAQ
jgi:hypothetical protein